MWDLLDYKLIDQSFGFQKKKPIQNDKLYLSLQGICQIVNDKILCERNGTIQHMDTYLNATPIQYMFLFE